MKISHLKVFSTNCYRLSVSWCSFLFALGWVNSFLGHPAWAPFGRLTYTAYLLHPIVLTIFTMQIATPTFASMTEMVSAIFLSSHSSKLNIEIQSASHLQWHKFEVLEVKFKSSFAYISNSFINKHAALQEVITGVTTKVWKKEVSDRSVHLSL